VKIRVLWFGKPRRSPWETEVEEYRNRVSRRWPAVDIPLKPENRSLARESILRREAETIVQRLPEDHLRVIMDEQGKRVDSRQFSMILKQWEERSFRGVSFIIGSDLGLDRKLKEGADLVLSLSRMTLPHMLARLVLWEQLYRATDILSVGRYHRERL